MVLLEKEPKIGGNSAKASSGINCAVSFEDRSHIKNDTLKSGGGLCDKKLVDVFIDQVPTWIFHSTLNGKGGTDRVRSTWMVLVEPIGGGIPQQD